MLKRLYVILIVFMSAVMISCGGSSSSGSGKTADNPVGQSGTELGSIDTDGDGTADGTAIDIDDDGVVDGIDTDGDGTIDTEWPADLDIADVLVDEEDSTEEDTEGDEENIVIGESGTTLGDVDTNSDGTADGSAIDIDGDGVPDGIDTDNNGTIDVEWPSGTNLVDVLLIEAEENMTDTQAVASDKVNLAITFASGDSATGVTQNITLPTSGSNGTAISWTSSDTSVIAADGTVTRPAYGSGNATVTLTATITKNGVSETKSFTVTVIKNELSSDASLSALSVNKGTLQPVFSSATTSYLDAPVPFSSETSPAYNDTQSVKITATASNSAASITINGTAVTSGTAYTMSNLAVGSNTATILVTAEDGTTATTYTVDVYRAVPVFKTGAGAISGYTLDTREDGYTQNGVSWPATRFTDNGDGSMTDEMTGLVWLKNLSTSKYDWINGISYCENLTIGRIDWRMPNVRELRSLVHYGQSLSSTWLNSHGFTGVQGEMGTASTPGVGGYYLTATTEKYNYLKKYAWNIVMQGGRMEIQSKSTDHFVWPVHGSSTSLASTGLIASYDNNGNKITDGSVKDDGFYQASVKYTINRFINNGDGTITDNVTGLMWVQNANAIGTLHTSFDSDGAVAWGNAFSFVTAINSGTYSCGVNTQYTDWRIPTVNELESLINYFGQTNPYTWLNNQGFSNVSSSRYWSSTTNASYPSSAWLVGAGNGAVSYSHKTSSSFVWPVRGPVQ